MPRVMFSNELNDFVKSFTAGAAVADANEERRLKQAKIDQDDKELRAKIPLYKAQAQYYLNGKDGSAVDLSFADEWRSNNDPYSGPDKLGSFGSAVSRTLKFEGGRGVDTNGAAVNMGINAEANPGVDVAHLTKPQAINIYKRNYWDAIDGDKLSAINPGLAHVAFDTAVNSGPGKAKELIALSGGDPLKLLSLREQFLHRLAQSRPNEFGAGVQKAWGDRIATLRRDVGGNQAFADGGMVGDGGEQRPYYVDDFANDVGSALSSIGEVVAGGLKGLQEKFGLNEQPAVAQADPDYQNRVTAFARGEGAPPPQQIDEAKKVVNPKGDMDDALATTYAMIKSYQHHLQRGDIKSAQQAAGAFLLYSKERAQRLGALAVQALQNGDDTAAKRALEHAFNITPNGQQVKIDGNTAIILDQKTGKPVNKVELNPEFMLKAAMGMTDGSAYMQNLMETASAGSGGSKHTALPDEAFNSRMAGYGDDAPAPAAPATGATASEATPAEGASTPTSAVPVSQPAVFSKPRPQPPDTRGMDTRQAQTIMAAYQAKVAEWQAEKSAFDKAQSDTRTENLRDAHETNRIGLNDRAPHPYDLKNPDNLALVDETLGWSGTNDKGEALKPPSDEFTREGMRSLMGGLVGYNPGMSMPSAKTALGVLLTAQAAGDKDEPAFKVEAGDAAHGTVRIKFKDKRLPPVYVPKSELDVLDALRGVVAQRVADEEAKKKKQAETRSALYPW